MQTECPTLAEADTPILRLFRIRCQMSEKINRASSEGGCDEDLDLAVDELREIEAVMMMLPSTCAADFAAKAIADTSEAGCLSEWQTGQLWKEARALAGCPV